MTRRGVRPADERTVSDDAPPQSTPPRQPEAHRSLASAHEKARVLSDRGLFKMGFLLRRNSGLLSEAADLLGEAALVTGGGVRVNHLGLGGLVGCG